MITTKKEFDQSQNTVRLYMDKLAQIRTQINGLEDEARHLNSLINEIQYQQTNYAFDRYEEHKQNQK